MVAMLLPAVSAVRAAEDRLQMRIDALRALEAIRMHADETGQLPKTLSNVTCVAVPHQPATQEPFPYKLENDMAKLTVHRKGARAYSAKWSEFLLKLR